MNVCPGEALCKWLLLMYSLLLNSLKSGTHHNIANQTICIPQLPKFHILKDHLGVFQHARVVLKSRVVQVICRC